MPKRKNDQIVFLVRENARGKRNAQALMMVTDDLGSDFAMKLRDSRRKVRTWKEDRDYYISYEVCRTEMTEALKLMKAHVKKTGREVTACVPVVREDAPAFQWTYGTDETFPVPENQK